jgi:hypothetical protein
MLPFRGRIIDDQLVMNCTLLAVPANVIFCMNLVFMGVRVSDL